MTVVSSNATLIGTLIGSSPATVVRQDNGYWVTIALDHDGVSAHYYPIFYTGASCAGDAFAYLESNPSPLFRSVQRMTATDATGYYPGDPATSASFPSMQIEDWSNPGTKMCVDTATYGWSGTQYVGPLQTIDISQFTAPFVIK